MQADAYGIIDDDFNLANQPIGGTLDECKAACSKLTYTQCRAFSWNVQTPYVMPDRALSPTAAAVLAHHARLAPRWSLMLCTGRFFFFTLFFSQGTRKQARAT